jgi:hypothetical protein
MGSSLADDLNSISIKGKYAYVTGYFSSSVDFEPNIKFQTVATKLSSKGGKDIFIGKYDLNGKLIWVKQIGNTKEENAKQIEIDKYKNIFVIGTFNTSSGSSTSFLGLPLATSGNNDVFLLKLDTLGKGIYAKKFSGSGSDYGSAIKTDTMQNVYVAGSYSGGITLETGANSITSNGINDVFIFKSLLNKESDSILHGIDSSSLVIENTLNFKIYPNPTNHSLYLNFEPLSINSSAILTDITGKIIMTKELKVGQNQETFETQHLTTGIYFISLNSGSSSYTYKLQKE